MAIYTTNSYAFEALTATPFQEAEIGIPTYAVSGSSDVVSFSFSRALNYVSSAQARSWCGGKRIDLSWTNPTGTTRVLLRRSSLGYPRFVDDPGETLYEGAPITQFVDGAYVGAIDTTNVALEEGQFYYYTIFYTLSAAPPYAWIHSLDAEVQGLSIKDYNAAEGHYVYDLLPREVRRADSDPSRGTNQYLHRDYADTLQCGVNILRGWMEALLHFRDPDLMPAGRLGDSSNNYGIIGAQCWDFGLPAGKALDAATLRRLAFSLVGFYENKGHCPNLVNVTKAVTTWDARCDEMAEPLCGVMRLAYTHDAESFINQFIPTVTAEDATTSVAGQVTLKTARLYDALGTTLSGSLALNPRVAFVIDALGTFACVETAAAESAGSQVLTFADPLAQLRKEILFTGAGALNSMTLTAMGTSTYPWQFPSPAAAPEFGENAFQGLKVMDSAGTVFAITASTASSGGTVVCTVAGTPANGNCSVAAIFDPAGASYAGRIPLLKAKLYTGEFTLTYDGLWDIRLREETATGPWSLITSVLSTTSAGWVPTPADVIIVAQNAHEEIGSITSVSLNSLEDTTQAWTINEWVNYYVIPEWNQDRLFRIVANTATELLVDMGSGAGGLDTFAYVDSNYVILSERNAIRYENLAAMLPSFMPIDTKLFIKFEDA